MNEHNSITRAIHAGSEILVVDDVRENLRLLVRMLVERGYKVRPVSNGRMALTAAQIAPPDLILLDILMPELDGYQVCQQLKADETTRHIPVIFISALHEQMDIVRAFAVGGVDYITKPFQTEETLARVYTHLTIGKLQQELAQKNQELQEQNEQLLEALANVKTLSGLLPICANCKKIRDDSGYWQTVEVYIRDHSDAILSHGICPDCMTELYPDYDR
ncbi:MAG TPA: response regulator [Chloroflexota bacterium]|nr:response regulator [Chloroflexota bacterium]HUM70213.1 response regulator [Chloroflexota bacterium]